MSLAYIRSLLPDVLGESPLIPEPPTSDPSNPDAPPPIVARRLDFVNLGLPEYEHKYACFPVYYLNYPEQTSVLVCQVCHGH
jgi:hypothetical protein